MIEMQCDAMRIPSDHAGELLLHPSAVKLVGHGEFKSLLARSAGPSSVLLQIDEAVTVKFLVRIPVEGLGSAAHVRQHTLEEVVAEQDVERSDSGIRNVRQVEDSPIEVGGTIREGVDTVTVLRLKVG